MDIFSKYLENCKKDAEGLDPVYLLDCIKQTYESFKEENYKSEKDWVKTFPEKGD